MSSKEVDSRIEESLSINEMATRLSKPGHAAEMLATLLAVAHKRIADVQDENDELKDLQECDDGKYDSLYQRSQAEIKKLTEDKDTLEEENLAYAGGAIAGTNKIFELREELKDLQAEIKKLTEDKDTLEKENRALAAAAIAGADKIFELREELNKAQANFVEALKAGETLDRAYDSLEKRAAADRDELLSANTVLHNRVNLLVAAITKHYDTFPDDALIGEEELWNTIGLTSEKY